MFYKKAELKRYRKYNGDKILKKNIYIWEKKNWKGIDTKFKVIIYK